MTEALVRVIAEQQAKIDALEANAKKETNRWIVHNEKLELFVASVFAMLNNASDAKARTKVKQQLVDMGYCLTCEQPVCECEGQFD